MKKHKVASKMFKTPKSYDNLLNQHLKELDKRKANAYNIGWASGENFIHSKTSKGRLYTERKNNKYSHIWENDD